MHSLHSIILHLFSRHKLAYGLMLSALFILSWFSQPAVSQAKLSEGTFQSIHPPLRLAIYYGWPSFVNHSQGNVNAAVRHFSQFDIVVLGDGLEHPFHADHKATATIIRQLVDRGVLVYGYVDMGVSTQNLSLSAAKRYVDEWYAMGVTGIFWDDAGFDFGVSRERQDILFDYTHQKGLSAFVNAWHLENVLADDPTPPHLGYEDFYLAESWMIGYGGYARMVDWQERIRKLDFYAKKIGVRVAAMGMGPVDGNATAPKHPYQLVYWSSALYGLDAVGYSDPYFGAGCALPNSLFIPPSEMPFYGNIFLDDPRLSLDEKTVTRHTDLGKVVVKLDGELSSAGFVPGDERLMTPVVTITPTNAPTLTPASSVTPTPTASPSPTPTASPLPAPTKVAFTNNLTISQQIRPHQVDDFLLVGDDIRIQIQIINTTGMTITSLSIRYNYAWNCLSYHYHTAIPDEDAYNGLTGVLEWRDLILIKGSPLAHGESWTIQVPFHLSKACYAAHNYVTVLQAQTEGGEILPVARNELIMHISTPKIITGKIFLDEDGDGKRSGSEMTGIPNLRVTATNRETGFIYTSVSNSLGNYFLKGLPPGRYLVNAPRIYDRDFQRTTWLPVEIFLNFLDDVRNLDVGYMHF